MQAEAKHVKTADVKKRLDSVFGPYDQFSELIVKPGFNSSSNIFGVVPVPMSPMIQGIPSAFTSSTRNNNHPLTSSNESLSDQSTSSSMATTISSAPYFTVPKVPVNEVLQSMQGLVESEPLAKLDCSTKKNCLVKESNGVVAPEKEKKKRPHPVDESAELKHSLKRQKKEAENEYRKFAKASSPVVKIEEEVRQREEAELLDDLFGEEDSNSQPPNESATPTDEKARVKEELLVAPSPHAAAIIKEEVVSSASPRIVLKIPRNTSNSSLSTMDVKKEPRESKSKHKKHRSEKSEKSERKKDSADHPRAPEPAPTPQRLKEIQPAPIEKQSQIVVSSTPSPPPAVQQEIDELEPVMHENSVAIDGSENRDFDPRYLAADVEQILEQFGRVSPLLSPLQKISPATHLEEFEEEIYDYPQPSTSSEKSCNHVLSLLVPKNCRLNLSNLAPKKCHRLSTKWQALLNGDHPTKQKFVKEISEKANLLNGDHRAKENVVVEKNVPSEKTQPAIEPEPRREERPETVEEVRPSSSSSHRNEVVSEKKPKSDRETSSKSSRKETDATPAKKSSSKKESSSSRHVEEKAKPPKFRHPEVLLPSESTSHPSAIPSVEVTTPEHLPKQSQLKQEPPALPPPIPLPIAVIDEPAPQKSTISRDALSEHDVKPSTSADSTERTMPTTKACLEDVEPSKQTVGYYQKLAKSIKHKGDSERDRIRKAMYYLECVVYFIMSASLQKRTESGNSEQQILSEVAGFLKSTTSNFTESRTESTHLNHFRPRVKAISSLVQSCLTYHLFRIKSLQAQTNYKALSQYEKDPNSAHHQLKSKTNNGGGDSVGGSSNTTTTPSPASSTPSSNRSNPCKEMITLPADVYSMLFNQNKILNHLMWAHKIRNDALTMMSQSNRGFVDHLNTICGDLKMDSDLKDAAIWLLTATKWMFREYEERLKTSSSSSK